MVRGDKFHPIADPSVGAVSPRPSANCGSSNFVMWVLNIGLWDYGQVIDLHYVPAVQCLPSGSAL